MSVESKGQLLISLENVSVGYGDKTILHGVSLSVSEGDFIGVIGPNGGGKTTLVKTILSLLSPTEGRVVRHRPDLRIGYLPQITTVDRLFPISVTGLVCSGEPSQKPDRMKARELLADMGISHLAGKQIGELSGGELQRVLLARALMCNPHLLVLDEPSTFVDNKFENLMYDLLHEINSTVAILMVSHDLGMISRHVRGIACVNRSVHYHDSNVISQHQLDLYDCPMQLLEHGKVPHTVLEQHDD